MVVWRIIARSLAGKCHPLREEVLRLQRSIDNPSSIELVPLSSTNKAALAHFDTYYPQVYGLAHWSSMRTALLCPSAKVAVLNRLAAGFIDRPQTPVRFKGCADLITHLLKEQHRQSNNVECNGSEKIKDQDIEPKLYLEKKSETWDLPMQLLGRNRPGYSLDPNNPSEFVPVTEFVGESEVYTREVDDDFAISHTSELETELPIITEPVCLPEQLRVLCLRRNRIQYLGSPRSLDDQFDFYPIDLASIIPVLALNLKQGDSLLDLCAAPGGKSVVALQTMLLSRLLCVDNSHSRLERLRQTLKYYGQDLIPNLVVDIIHETELGQLVRRETDNSSGLFDKVLVDVPCSTDRHALSSDLGSVFSRGRAKARLTLTTTQSRLLWRAMTLCRPGGVVVYSTCTLSPAQNQIVVQSCLERINQQEDGRRFALVDLRPLSRLFFETQSVFGLRSHLVYASDRVDAPPLGLLIVPSVSANYGPSFVAKLKRLS